MKKIIITENQLNMINESINQEDDNRFRKEVKVSIGSHGNLYGWIVDDVRTYNDKMILSYLIEEDYRKWGINGISIMDIKGPSEIEVILECYEEDSDEMVEKEITIPLDWENSLYTENRTGEGIISIDDTLEISLYFRENNEIETELSIDVYNL